MANKLRTPLCDELGIEYPIILAGMAVGGTQETAPTPIKLVAEVAQTRWTPYSRDFSAR